MAKVYAALIRKGLKTLDDVPAALRDEVAALRQWLLSILLRKEVQEMAVVYATLIIKGRKTMDQVPALLKEQVAQILADLEVEV